MIIPGLCSVTFRRLSVDEIIALCRELKIPSIEWGGDIHVPHGDIQTAVRTRELCTDAGIGCPSYGSYYRVGISEDRGLSFSSVLKTAAAMDVETIRVWGGEKDYGLYTSSEMKEAVEDTKRIADMAAESGMTVSFEYHENSLTHTPESLQSFDRDVNHPYVRYYWQPPHMLDDDACLSSLEELGNRLTNLHVFQWRLTGLSEPDKRLERLPLEEGTERWQHFLKAVDSNDLHYAYLEFVKNDEPGQLRKDWDTFRKIIPSGQDR